MNLPDGFPNHVLLPLGQKVAVVLVDIRDDAILVHHDEAVLGLVQKLLKNQPVPMILRHAGSPFPRDAVCAIIKQACGKMQVPPGRSAVGAKGLSEEKMTHNRRRDT